MKDWVASYPCKRRKIHICQDLPKPIGSSTTTPSTEGTSGSSVQIYALHQDQLCWISAGDWGWAISMCASWWLLQVQLLLLEYYILLFRFGWWLLFIVLSTQCCLFFIFLIYIFFKLISACAFIYLDWNMVMCCICCAQNLFQKFQVIPKYKNAWNKRCVLNTLLRNSRSSYL